MNIHEIPLIQHKDLIEKLDQCIPIPRVHPKSDMNRVMFLSGQRDLVDVLVDILRQQEDNPIDTGVLNVQTESTES